MKKLFILLLLGLQYSLQLENKLRVLENIEESESQEEKEDTTNYDMYVFSVQWGMTMCEVDRSQICKQKLALVPKNHMSIHGLWPSLRSGKMLPDCNPGPQIPIKDDGSEIINWMKHNWPSLKGADESFWTHEYNKHGYCYSEVIGDFEPKYYFMKAREEFLSKKLGTLIIDTFGSEHSELELSYNELVSKLSSRLGGKYFTPVCVGSRTQRTQKLSELRFNLDLNFNFLELSKGDSCSKTKPITMTFRP